MRLEWRLPPSPSFACGASSLVNSVGVEVYVALQAGATSLVRVILAANRYDLLRAVRSVGPCVFSSEKEV